MIQLFNGMQSSLSMVYDREMGNMRTLLVSPLPRWYLLCSKLVAGVAVSLLQVYVFLLIAWFWEIEPPPLGYLSVLPGAGALRPDAGLARHADLLGDQAARELRRRDEFRDLSDVLRLLRALSAVAGARGSPALYYICQFNPFTHAVELIRFALYGQINWISLAVVCGCTAVFMVGAIFAYDPSRGLLARRGEAGGST